MGRMGNQPSRKSNLKCLPTAGLRRIDTTKRLTRNHSPAVSRRIIAALIGFPLRRGIKAEGNEGVLLICDFRTLFPPPNAILQIRRNEIRSRVPVIRATRNRRPCTPAAPLTPHRTERIAPPTASTLRRGIPTEPAPPTLSTTTINSNNHNYSNNTSPRIHTGPRRRIINNNSSSHSSSSGG